MIRTILFLLLLLPLTAVVPQAPDLKGNNELSLQGLFDFQGPSGDNIDLRVNYGWFMGNDLLLGLGYQWSLVEDVAPGNSDYRAQQISLMVDFLIPGDSALVPYYGAELGFRSADFGPTQKSGLVLGASVGARYFLSQSVAIDASISYSIADKKVFIVDFRTEDDYLYPSIGINAIF